MHLLRELQDWPLGHGWLPGGPAESIALTVRVTECDWNCAWTQMVWRGPAENQVGGGGLNSFVLLLLCLVTALTSPELREA